MSENATETQATAADPFAAFGVMAAPLSMLIPQLKEKANDHDELVARLAVKKDEEPTTDVLEGTRLRNKSNNSKVTQLNKTIEQAEKKIADLKEQAYALIQPDLPTPLTEEETTLAQTRVGDLRKGFTATVQSIIQIGGPLGFTEEQLLPIIPTIMQNGKVTTAGTSKRGGSTGPRLHLSEVRVDGVLAQMKKSGGAEGEMTSSLTAAALEITKIVKSKVNAGDLATALFAAAGVSDSASVPDSIEFTYVYSSGEHKREFKISAKK